MSDARPIRLAIVGCGDVLRRHYLPALEPLADVVRVEALVDPRRGAAAQVAADIAGWSPGARA